MCQQQNRQNRVHLRSSLSVFGVNVKLSKLKRSRLQLTLLQALYPYHNSNEKIDLDQVTIILVIILRVLVAVICHHKHSLLVMCSRVSVEHISHCRQMSRSHLLWPQCQPSPPSCASSSSFSSSSSSSSSSSFLPSFLRHQKNQASTNFITQTKCEYKVQMISLKNGLTCCCCCCFCCCGCRCSCCLLAIKQTFFGGFEKGLKIQTLPQVICHKLYV